MSYMSYMSGYNFISIKLLTFSTTSDTYTAVRAVHNISEFVTAISVWTGQGYVEIDLDSVHSVMPNLPYNCMLLDLDRTPDLKLKEIRQIFFNFNKSIFGLEIMIGDRDLYTDREIKQNKFFFSGEQPYISKQSNKRHSTQSNFIVELSQQRFVEADATENCTNYPGTHQTYNDCDKT